MESEMSRERKREEEEVRERKEEDSRAHAVRSRGKAAGHGGGELASTRGLVQSLCVCVLQRQRMGRRRQPEEGGRRTEEGEGVGVEDGRLREGLHLLDDDVRVADELRREETSVISRERGQRLGRRRDTHRAGSVDLSRSGVVVLGTDGVRRGG